MITPDPAIADLRIAADGAVTVCAPPVLVDAKTSAALCGISESKWRSMNSAGQVPAPIRLGGSVRWRLEEIVGWTRAGCPGRARWEMQQQQ